MNKEITRWFSKLDEKKSNYEVFLKNHTYDEFRAYLMDAFLANPDIVNATRESLAKAIRDAFMLEIPPNGREGAIVVYRGKNGTLANFLPMYKGIFNALSRHGKIGGMVTNIVYRGDNIQISASTNELMQISHSINPECTDRGEAIGCYSIVHYNLSPFSHYMTKKEILKRKPKHGGFWKGEFEEEMWKKTVLKYVLMRIPIGTRGDLETQLQRISEHKDYIEINEALPKVEAPVDGDAQRLLDEVGFDPSSWEDGGRA